MPRKIRTARPEVFKGLIEPPFNVDRLMSCPIPLSIFGWFWSSTMRVGASGLLDVPHDRLMTLRYECLLKELHAELARLASFLGVPAEKHWLDEAKKFTGPRHPAEECPGFARAPSRSLRAFCAFR